MGYEDILETNHIRRFFIDMLMLAMLIFMFMLFVLLMDGVLKI